MPDDLAQRAARPEPNWAWIDDLRTQHTPEPTLPGRCPACAYERMPCTVADLLKTIDGLAAALAAEQGARDELRSRYTALELGYVAEQAARARADAVIALAQALVDHMADNRPYGATLHRLHVALAALAGEEETDA